jgi:hypothetical protein
MDGVATPELEIDAAAEALFEEARRRTRRRRRRQGAIAAFLGLGAVTMSVVLHSGGGQTESEPAVTTVMSEQILAGPPYMGVSCRRPNSIACDRVGLAVWTKDPARHVSASIAGRPLVLPFGGPWCCKPGDRTDEPRRQFIGFLHRAGLRGPGPLAVQVENGRNRWTGIHPVSAPVRITVTYGDGSRQTTTVWVGLAAGWG